MSRRRVWHLCSNRWNSAITEYALRSTQALGVSGWDSIISGKPGSHCERRAKGFGVVGPSFRFKLRDLPRMRAFVREFKPDIIVCYGGPETFLARFLGRPVVRFRGQDSDVTDELSPWGLRFGLGFCRAILSPAEIVRKRFAELLPRLAHKSVTLGLDEGVFHFRETRSERPTLLIVGRLDPIKGHREFFELYARFLRLPDVGRARPFLEVIGQSSNLRAEDLIASAQGFGLRKDEDFAIVDARVDDLPERMAKATLGIIPSLGSEVIGRVTEEFLLSGTPVLVAPVGSLSECLKREDFGDILDETSLVRWFTRAIQETDTMRRSRSTEARTYFSLSAMGRDLGAFFTDLLDRR